MIGSSTGAQSYTWEQTAHFIHKKKDFILDLGIFAITTTLLAAKIFKSTPKILPRTANFLYAYGGILYLDSQVKEFLKSYRDLRVVLDHTEGHNTASMIAIAAKVFLTGTAIIFTLSTFSGSLLAATGYSSASMSIVQTLRPLGVADYTTRIASDIYDYWATRACIEEFEICREPQQIQKVIQSFYRMIPPKIVSVEVENEDTSFSLGAQAQKIADYFVALFSVHETFAEEISQDRTSKEYRTALAIFRQLDMKTLEIYREKGTEGITRENLCAAVKNRNTGTKIDLLILALGKVTMGISKAYPETVADLTGRWVISLIYTTKLVNREVFLYNQSDSRKTT